MKTSGRRKSKNVITLKTEEDKRAFSKKNKMDKESKANAALRDKTPISKQKSTGTKLGNIIKNSVKSTIPGAALESGLRLKNLKDTAKPGKFKKKGKDK